MTKVVSDLLNATDRLTPAVLLALDISAAFDMLDHQRLLARAKNLFGFDNVALRWLQSYLSGRQQFVSVGGKNRRLRRRVLGYHRDLYSVRYFSHCLPLQSAR